MNALKLVIENMHKIHTNKCILGILIREGGGVQLLSIDNEIIP
jgi:hypothetical protein